jgi:hypothetical protein
VTTARCQYWIGDYWLRPTMPAARAKVLQHASGATISTTAAMVRSTVAATAGRVWAGEMRLPSTTDLVPIYALEAASYPADEAASEEGMKFRLATAPTFFRAFYCTKAPHAPVGASLSHWSWLWLSCSLASGLRQRINPRSCGSHRSRQRLLAPPAPGDLLGFINGTLAPGEVW